MSDLETLLRQARQQQAEEPVLPPGKERPARIGPWAVLAAIFVVISLGIHFFWPVPHKAVLPRCEKAVTVSCQKP